MTEDDICKPKSGPEQNEALSEDELGDVSGGLFGITIIDTCQKKYDYNHCCNNFGNCPQLYVIGEYIAVENGRKMRHITCGCNKGYFFGITDGHLY